MLGLACNDIGDDSNGDHTPVENSSLLCPRSPNACESGNSMDKDALLWHKVRDYECQQCPDESHHLLFRRMVNPFLSY